VVGGTSPFATRKAMPVFMERSIAVLPRLFVNGGSRGFLVGITGAPDLFGVRYRPRKDCCSGSCYRTPP